MKINNVALASANMFEWHAPFTIARRLCTLNCAAPTDVMNLKAGSAAPRAKSRLKMSGWQIHSYGGIEELQYADNLKIPQIRNATECLVRVRSTTVNPIDVAMLSGYGAKVLNTLRCQPGSIEFPLTLGREFCGEIVQAGMGVNTSNVTLGERVWGVVPPHQNGSQAQYVCVPEHCLSRAPNELTDEEAASVLYAGLTAWSGLYLTGRLGGVCGAMTSAGGGANKRVLVLGGSGSVGSLAIQMLKSQKAQVLATCSEDAIEMVRNVGADYVVNYKSPAELESLRSYAPFDLVLDCAGQGAKYAETLNIKFYQYVTFSSPLLRNIDNSGMALGMIQNLADLVQTNAKALAAQGGLVKWGFFAPAPQGVKFLKKLVEGKKLLPLINSSFTFEQLPDAFKKAKGGHMRGKVVVNVN